MKTTRFCLEVSGEYACFSRPEMKTEKMSYNAITPSAGRAVFEAILWKPGIRWRLRRVEVLKPVRWISVRRNEVGAVASSRKALATMHEGRGVMALYIEDERQQRAGLFLRDVAYRLHADMKLVSDEARANPAKYISMFERRAAHGQCVNQPYLGCREFAARFRPVRLVEADGDYRAIDGEPPAVQEMTADLGWMLYDLGYEDPANPRPRFFKARVERGVMDLANVEVRG
jgi:CRISPR-associated protein Cas5d